MAPLFDVLGRRFTEALFYLTVTVLFLTCFKPVLLNVLVFLCVTASYRVTQRIRLRRLPTHGKSVLITGCDTGFGNALARYLDRKGMRVFATCLSESSEGARHLRETGSERMRVVQMDVTSDESVTTCLEKVQRLCQNEGLWAVVNNAGVICQGLLELQTMANYKMLFDVNLLGMVRVCKAFLPLIRKSRGRVVNVTSVQGIRVRHMETAYVTSKFGAEGFSDSLRLEMRRFGVKVIVVEPGGYALNTAQYNAENVKRHLRIKKELVEGASDEIREAYGAAYLQTLLKVREPVTSNPDEMMQPVIDALEEAVLACHPNTRYLVDDYGKLSRGCNLARLMTVLPPWITDPLYFYFWPLQ